MTDLYRLIFVIFLSIGIISCSKVGDAIKPNKTFAADSINESNVSYENYIYPLLKKNCSTCHGPKGSAEVWWLNENSYTNAIHNAKTITTTIVNGTMPPAPKFPFTEKDKSLIQAWIDKGMPNN